MTKRQQRRLITLLFLVVSLLFTFFSSRRTVSTPSVSVSSTSPGSIATYAVVSIIDGDTIKVDLNGKTETVRLIGIDTPETKDPRQTVQCFGQEASTKMNTLVSSQSVALEADPSQGERDKYGRLLRYVFLPDGTNVNLLMIKEGYAHEYTYDLPYKYQKEFRQAETDARTKNLGLWSPTSCNGNTSS